MKKEIRQTTPLVSPLLQHQNDITSQSGEDGVIDHIMSVLQPTNRYCVEFGAWDGKKHSNCYNLAINKGWDGLMIEAHPAKYALLLETYRAHPNVRTLNQFVEFEGQNSLDNILAEHGAPAEPGLISIDIDGNDYYVWESLNAFKPELVIVEFNPTIPNDVVFVQERSMNVTQGCSLLALVELGQAKGYELVACVGWNAFFVKNGNAAVLGVKDTSHFSLYRPLLDGRIFHSPDQVIHVVGMDRMLWDGPELTSEDFQVTAKSDRIFLDGQTKSAVKALARFDEALAHHKAGRLAAAAEAYAFSIDLKPDYAEAFNNRGSVLLSLGHLEEAAACYRRALIFKLDDSDTHCNLGAVLVKMGEFAEAEKSFANALMIAPNHFRAHFNLGVALSSMGRRGEAIVSFQKALSIKPDSAEVREALANI